jgi:nitrogen-specific signal transduction histidine kinase/CheY-like chemotaxis protein
LSEEPVVPVDQGEIAMRQLFESRMAQLEKLASLGQRVAGIVHELSNPLTTILGNAQRMVLRNEEDASLPEAQRILDEAERATAILRQLLSLSRESKPEHRLVSLNEIVERTADLQRLALAGGPIRMRIELAEDLPEIQGDFGELQQVLLNLLQNSRQAMELSGQGSTIGVRTIDTGAGRVRLEVWDDGPGIPSGIQSRIFDPFFTTKPSGIGTGLGLTIVQAFVRQHGGTVEQQSQAGRGSRFIVELPSAEKAAVPPETESGAEPPRLPAQLPPQLSGISRGAARVQKQLKILVIEDEPTVAHLIADVLQEEGMKVDVLLDSRAALEKAQQESYDLAVCDLQMPEMDGQIFYDQLLQMRNPLRERMLFVTGDLVTPRAQEFLESHLLPHVAKPFRVEELTWAVHRVLWGNSLLAKTGNALATEGALGNG